MIEDYEQSVDIWVKFYLYNYRQISNSVFQASLAAPFTSNKFFIKVDFDILGWTSAYLCQSQNIGNVYKMTFSSITYSSVSLTTTSGATASIHQKNYPYIMGKIVIIYQ